MMSPGMCAEAYKGPHATSLGVHSWSVSWWVRRYMLMHRLTCWCAHIARAYFLQTYLIGLLWFLCKCLPPGCTNTLWELPWNTVLDLMSTVPAVPLCLLVGALFIELLSLHLQKCVVLRQNYPPCVMHITIIGVPGWAPIEYTSGPNHELHSTMVATWVIKCSYRKEGEQWYILV